jgi:hypothetical protein
MLVLRVCHNMLAIAYNQWALREINPLHPDVPRILLRLSELRDTARTLLG